MKQEERYMVLQALTSISDHEVDASNLMKEIHDTSITYNFFEDLFEILYDFPYDKHLVYVRVFALLSSYDKEIENIMPLNI